MPMSRLLSLSYVSFRKNARFQAQRPATSSWVWATVGGVPVGETSDIGERANARPSWRHLFECWRAFYYTGACRPADKVVGKSEARRRRRLARGGRRHASGSASLLRLLGGVIINPERSRTSAPSRYAGGITPPGRFDFDPDITPPARCNAAFGTTHSPHHGGHQVIPANQSSLLGGTISPRT
jgi:hypothetical protein